MYVQNFRGSTTRVPNGWRDKETKSEKRKLSSKGGKILHKNVKTLGDGWETDMLNYTPVKLQDTFDTDYITLELANLLLIVTRYHCSGEVQMVFHIHITRFVLSNCHLALVIYGN